MPVAQEHGLRLAGLMSKSNREVQIPSRRTGLLKNSIRGEFWAEGDGSTSLTTGCFVACPPPAGFAPRNDIMSAKGSQCHCEEVVRPRRTIDEAISLRAPAFSTIPDGRGGRARPERLVPNEVKGSRRAGGKRKRRSRQFPAAPFAFITMMYCQGFVLVALTSTLPSLIATSASVIPCAASCRLISAIFASSLSVLSGALSII